MTRPAATLSTDHAPARERVGCWGDMVWRAFGRLRTDTYGDEQFHGRIECHDLDGVQLCRLNAARHRVVRTAGAGGLSDPGYLKMVLQHRGHSVFEQNGRRARLAPGSWSVYDTTRSYTVSNPEEVEQYVLLLPREAVFRGRRDLDNVLVRPLASHAGMSRLACETVRHAVAEADRTPTALRPDLGEVIVRAVRLALLEQLGAEAPLAPRAIMRARIKAYLETRLGNPALDAASLAHALNCSKRTLHNAFEGEPATLHEYLWEQRIEAARRSLERASAADQPISAIAFACGFSSAAHFSRAFRARYGMSPREWRDARRAPAVPAP